MKFKESQLAHDYLDGLKGIEIGGSAHNPFGLDTINVDYTDEMTEWKEMEIKECGEALKVDVVSPGDKLPFKDKSWDYVLSSHVIEHFWDPIKALLEWKRVARKYIFLIVPHRERNFDKGRELTTVGELRDRHFLKVEQPAETPYRGHWSVWDLDSFMDLCNELELKVITYEDPDSKVGNGFTIVISLEEGDTNG